MPKVPMDYSNTIIYKIQHIELDELIYIGHTTNFNKRKYQHKNNSINENAKDHQALLYQTIKNNGGWDMFKMIQIKTFSCANLREAAAEEDKLMMELNATMNKNRPQRSQKQWTIDNKISLAQYQKEYKIVPEHKEQRLRKIVCDCGSTILCNDKARHLRTLKHQTFLTFQ